MSDQHGNEHGHGHGHGHGHAHGGPRREMPPLPDDASGLPAWWEELYSGVAHHWSGRPNARLVEVLDGFAVPPGRALDLGCGEGGDAVWLAGRGWQVTAVDVAQGALDRAGSAAAERGVDVELQRHDLTRTFPSGEFDLVNAQFLQAPVGWPRPEVLRRAAAAVAPGGMLLVVDHADPPPWSDLDRDAVGFPTPQEVLADLGLADGGSDGWRVERAEVAARDATGPDGGHGHLNDSVVVLRRVP